MTRFVLIAVPEMSIRDAAQLMAEMDAGALPVSASGAIVGMITDRDIAIRAVGQGLPPETTVSEVMTPQVTSCQLDDDLDTVLDEMGRQQIRRMPVLDAAGSLAGIVSLSDLILETRPTDSMDAIEGISEPGGNHSQSDEEGLKPI
jgi:CBS domain-containing protein